MIVKLKKSALAYFKRKARACDPNEIMVYLVGTVKSPKKAVIDKFVYPQLYSQKRCGLETVEGEEERIRAEAATEGMTIVGSIHSHPNWWPHLSDLDHDTHIGELHRVSGVYGWIGKKGIVLFWLAESSLACDIEYVKKA